VVPIADDDALTAAAAELYALPLGRFTAERAARAKAVRADGDRDLAARISALPKPSAAAWLVDALAAPDDLQRVLDLGKDLRQAQEAADRDRLRELTAERRALLPEVARAAAARAEAVGQHVSDAVLEELQQTLQAALASAAAAAAIRTGRLVRALAADGLDPVDLGDAVAGGAPEPGQDAPRAKRRSPEPDDGEQERREAEQRAAEQARRLEEARDRARSAAAQARDTDALTEDRCHDVEDLRRRLDDLQTRLESAQRALDAAGAAAEEAHRAADDAAAEADRLASGT